MEKGSTKGEPRSSPTWEGLHQWLRERVQALIQELLGAEVRELLGQARYQRRAAVDAPTG